MQSEITTKLSDIQNTCFRHKFSTLLLIGFEIRYFDNIRETVYGFVWYPSY